MDHLSKPFGKWFIIASLLLGLCQVAQANTVTDDFTRTSLGTNWTLVRGTWTIDTNALYQTNSYPTYTGLVILNVPLDTSDVDAQASFEFTDLVGGNHRGMVVRYQDANNFYYGQFLRDGARFRIVKVAGGVWTTLADVPGYWGTNFTSHPIRLVAQGSSLKLYIDGTLQASATDTTFATGKVGMYTSVYYAHIDNFSVTTLAGTDTTPPTGTVTINTGAALTNTTAVTLTLSATDNAGPVSQMQFSNDNETYAAAVAYATSASWTLATGDGTKTVYAKFKDPSGNWSAAASDTITLDTTLPTISMVTSSSLTSSGATVTWTTNEAATSQVDYGTTTSYGQLTTLDAALVTSHSVALTGLTASTLYHYRVRAKDAAGNQAIGTDATFTTTAAASTTTVTFQRSVSPTTGYATMYDGGLSPSASVSPRANPEVIYFNYPQGTRLLSYFDLSSIPAGSTITGATLSYDFYNGASIQAPIGVYRVRTNWVGGAAWINPGGDWVDKNGINQGTTPFATYTATTNGWYRWDVTSMVQNWLSGTASNYGVVLKVDSSVTGWGQTYASGHATGGVHPTLQVTYSPPPGPTITSFNVAPNPTKPFLNQPATLSVSATSAGTMQYQFLKDGTVLCGWATTSTCAWTPGTADVGVRGLQVQVKDASGTTSQTKNVFVLHEPVRTPQ